MLPVLWMPDTKRAYTQRFSRGQRGFDSAAYVRTDSPGAAPDRARGRSLLSTIALLTAMTSKSARDVTRRPTLVTYGTDRQPPTLTSRPQ